MDLMNRLRRWLCSIGWHRWETIAVHDTRKPADRRYEIMSWDERCRRPGCGLERTGRICTKLGFHGEAVSSYMTFSSNRKGPR